MKQEMKPEDIRRAGWAIILGGIAFVISIFMAISTGNDGSLFGMLLLLFVSLPLLVFGVLGLRKRYGEKTGSFGRGILLMGAILGPLTSIIGFLVMSAGDPLWLVIWASPAVLFLCLTLFGVAVLHTKPMPRWNILPILGGLGYPVIILAHALNALATRDWSSPAMPYAVIMALITIQGAALMALGYILKADVPQETLTLA